MIILRYVIALAGLMLLLHGCKSVKYRHYYEFQKGLNFRNGTWLVNNIQTDLPWRSKGSLTNNLVNKLKTIAGDSIIYIDEARIDFLLPNDIPFELPSQTLELLQLTTDFDYLINVRTFKIREEVGDLVLSDPTGYAKSESEVQIIVYEIKSGQIIYDQRIIASVEIDENDDDITFAKSADNLIFSALKKGLKEMKKYSATR